MFATAGPHGGPAVVVRTGSGRVPAQRFRVLGVITLKTRYRRTGEPVSIPIHVYAARTILVEPGHSTQPRR